MIRLGIAVTAVAASLCHAHAQLEPGTHLYSMMRTYTSCPNIQDQNAFNPVRLYRSKDDRYFYYLTGNEGVVFPFDGGVVEQDLGGLHVVTELSVDPMIDVLSMASDGRATVSLGVRMSVQGGRCQVLGCTFESDIGDSLGCEHECRVTQCEVRDGPASN